MTDPEKRQYNRIARRWVTLAFFVGVLNGGFCVYLFLTL
jgi:hypothetical protein